MLNLRMGNCTLCEKPAVGAINGNANAAATAEPRWELRCDEHNPYWNPSFLTTQERVYELQKALREIADKCRSSRAQQGRYASTVHDCMDIAHAALKGKST